MTNPKSRNRGKIIAAVIGLVSISLLAGGFYMKRRDVAIAVQKEKATRRDLTELVVANGKIHPVVQVTIAPEVSGEITELPFKEGQAVQKGDLLIRIKPDDYIAARNSSEANYKYAIANQDTAQANLERAELDFHRNEDLFKHKLISDTAFLETKTTYDVAKATLAGAIQQVEMAHAALAKADSDLYKTTIYSPLTGTISKLNSQVGERVVGTAMMAGTEIMTISDLNEMEARVDIGETDVILMGVGQNVRLEVDAFKDRKFKGTVTEIANSSKNSGTGSAAAAAASSSSSQEATKFEVKIRISEKEAFRPGMSVTAEIETRYRTNALTIPIQSVTTRMPKSQTNVVQLAGAVPANGVGEKHKGGEPATANEVVFVIEGDHVKSVPVKRGISDDNYVEIVDGLTEGQEIVSGGYKAINRELEDGKHVKVGSATSGSDNKPVKD